MISNKNILYIDSLKGKKKLTS